MTRKSLPLQGLRMFVDGGLRRHDREMVGVLPGLRRFQLTLE